VRAFDAVVIGGGVMGSATARSMARDGRRVALLEQFEIGHDRGSSHGTSRIFRFSYHDPMYVRMAMESLPLWRELEAEAGEQILITLGGLDVGKALDEHVAALSACGAKFEVIDGREVGARFPGPSLPADERILFQPDAGIVSADRAVQALVRSAGAHGAEIVEHARVTRLDVRESGVGVETDGERFDAAVAVVTAGAWAPGLLAASGYELGASPSRETVAYFRAAEELSYPTVVDWGEPSVYALPAPGQGIKAGEHHGGPTIDPATDGQGPPEMESVSRLSAWIAERYPEADPEPYLIQTCLYTNTLDEHFVLDRRGALVVGSPCSGHGFKFAPLIGERLAALAFS
jgi:monomeric sarcosine oxidase